MNKPSNKTIVDSLSNVTSPTATDIRPVDFSTGSDVVIRIEDLWKEYRLGIINHGTLSKDLNSWWAKVRGKEDPNRKIDSTIQQINDSTIETLDRFWALKDISFDVKQGEVLGVIGKNGAGKSTLLKILSQVTTPTKGLINIKGRVASLLEVGTGFHPELTGRENVFLNGAILGMSKQEIRRKFHAIVDFAEIEKFIDTPVKRYSSGMYVRLAFAVAAYLEPEILIVDEVLAVGDTVFQKKCIDKMLEVSAQGRTILFVSHNFSAIKSLCSRAVLLNKGQCVFSGKVEETIDVYAGEKRLSGREIDLSNVERKNTAQELVFEKITFLNYPVRFGVPIKFKVKLKSMGMKRVFPELDFGFAIHDKNQNTIIHCSNRYKNLHFEHVSDADEYLFEIENILKPDVYSLVFFLRSNEVIQDWISGVVKLEIEDGNPYEFHDTKQIQGALLPEFNISFVRASQ
ncbi:polysaccharide ABC transporter ATP-binding protein [Deltaproteobacteria bacterium IMCC39524]|nr:polysaccharide ABC transporter ATP-binding protein [Deltaproteobacteria bacterium IMCC39524]